MGPPRSLRSKTVGNEARGFRVDGWVGSSRAADQRPTTTRARLSARCPQTNTASPLAPPPPPPPPRPHPRPLSFIARDDAPAASASRMAASLFSRSMQNCGRSLASAPKWAQKRAWYISNTGSSASDDEAWQETTAIKQINNQAQEGLGEGGKTKTPRPILLGDARYHPTTITAANGRQAKRIQKRRFGPSSA